MPEALRGTRVLDLSVIIFGPATAGFLGDLGAEVIKVEMPGQGNVTRILGHGGCWWKGVSVAFFPQNTASTTWAWTCWDHRGWPS
jgi:crotonobetainyl-CoA:carnitine CoA-transferase CaiB-like acyl-CoA transferase